MLRSWLFDFFAAAVDSSMFRRAFLMPTLSNNKAWFGFLDRVISRRLGEDGRRVRDRTAGAWGVLILFDFLLVCPATTTVLMPCMV